MSTFIPSNPTNSTPIDPSAPINSRDNLPSLIRGTLARLPAKAGPAVGNNEITAHVETLGHKGILAGTHLNTFIRNASATLKMMHSAGSAMGALFIEKAKEGPRSAIIAFIGLTLSGTSLLAQAAIKAAIWVPVIIGTTLIGLGGAGLGGLFSFSGLGPLFGKTGDLANFAETGFKLGANVSGAVLGRIASVISTAVALPRLPFFLIGVLGSWLLERKMPENPQKQELDFLILQSTFVQTFQDSFNLFSGRDNLWRSVIDNKDTTNTKEIRLIALLAAGANPYSKEWKSGTSNLLLELNETATVLDEDVDKAIEKLVKDVGGSEQSQTDKMKIYIEDLKKRRAALEENPATSYVDLSAKTEQTHANPVVTSDQLHIHRDLSKGKSKIEDNRSQSHSQSSVEASEDTRARTIANKVTVSPLKPQKKIVKPTPTPAEEGYEDLSGPKVAPPIEEYDEL